MNFYTKGNKLRNNKIYYKNRIINKNIITNHINSSITNKLINKNSSTDLAIYSSQNPYGGVGDAGYWTRNPNCWLNGVKNISCFSPAQRSGAYWYQRGGTLITRKHFILAKHFVFAILDGGTPIIFVDENNNAISRKLISYSYDLTDIAIGVLDSEVPSNIQIAKVLPPNYTNYINTSSSKYVISSNQSHEAIAKTTTLILSSYFVSDGNGGNVNIPLISIDNLSSSDPYYSFTKTIITGDSGQPSFFIIDNELVLLTTWWSANNGPFTSTRYDAINNMINSLSPNEGYSLTPVDLDLVYHKYS